MSGLRKIILFLSIFMCLTAVTVAPKPAYAQMQVNDPGVLAQAVAQVKYWASYIKEFTSFVNGLFELVNKQIMSILGTTDMAPIKCQSGTKIPDPKSSVPLTAEGPGLVQYLRDCKDAIDEERLKKMQAENSAMIAASRAQGDRMMDAQAYSNFKSKMDDRMLNNVLASTGTAEALCAPASLIVSNLAAEYAVLLDREQMMKEELGKTGGDKGTPQSKGPVEYAMQLVDARIKLRVCSNIGQDAVDSLWCKETNEAVKNRDLSSEVYSVPAFQKTDKEKSNWDGYEKMYRDAVFSGREIPAIPASAVKDGKLSGAAYELLAQRFKYMALLSTFQQPFVQAAANRAPMQDLRAMKSLRAALERAGYKGEAFEKYMGPDGNSISLEAMRDIQYSVVYKDPQKIVNDLSQATANATNVTAFNAMISMNIVTLLWEILKQQEMMNRQIGGLGALESKDFRREIDQYVNTISAGTN